VFGTDERIGLWLLETPLRTDDLALYSLMQMGVSARYLPSHSAERIGQVIAMSKLIQVSFMSPAFEFYVNDGWCQVSVSRLWATLRYEPDHKKSSAGNTASGAGSKPVKSQHTKDPSNMSTGERGCNPSSAGATRRARP
jgi:hypothetical protein